MVEMKRHLSFDLLVQAVERQSYADAVYVSIPKPNHFKQDKPWKAKIKVLRQLGLGLLLVSKSKEIYWIEEALIPEALKVKGTANKKRKALEKEFDHRSLDLNTGGSRGVPLVTAYRETALHTVYLLSLHGPQTPAGLKALGAHPQKTAGILRANYYDWFEKNEDRSYRLTEAGYQALEDYAPLIRAFASSTGENSS